MRLLVLTQAVDRDDPALGFFHTWLAALAPHTERLEVVCLRKGAHTLSSNVRVHSLGKERGVSRATYVLRFYRHLFSLSYDAVFVHMNEEYVLLGGLLWRLMGKRVVLWRNHKMGTWRTRLAMHLAHAVCYTSPEAFTAHYPSAVRMPVGIDTDAYTPPQSPPPMDSVLFFGRIDPVKKVDVFLDALAQVSMPIHASLVGSPTEHGAAYAADMARRAAPLIERGALTTHPAVPHATSAALYRTHAIYVNLTPSGSFDKTIGEAMASGCAVVCANRAVRAILPPALFVERITPEDVARAVEAALALSAHERAALARRGREYIEREHSLSLLISRLAELVIG